MNRRVLVASSVVALTLIACGGGEGAPPKGPESAPAAEPAPLPPPGEEASKDSSNKASQQDAVTPEPRTIEEAQRQIDRAVADLNGAPAKDAKPGKTPASEPGGGTKADDMGKPASPCNALASMRRAVEALCRLTGETNNKCVEARKTLATNATKTASFKCKD